MKSYAERAKDAGVQDLPQTLRPCGWCGEATKHDTLATLGARCARCYQSFCYLGSQPTPDVGDKGRQGDKSWAYALKRREDAGERLSGVQRSMWRTALPKEAA